MDPNNLKKLKRFCRKEGLGKEEARLLHKYGMEAGVMEKARVYGIRVQDMVEMLQDYKDPLVVRVVCRILGILDDVPA